MTEHTDKQRRRWDGTVTVNCGLFVMVGLAIGLAEGGHGWPAIGLVIVAVVLCIRADRRAMP